MRRELVLGGTALLVVGATLVASVAVPGVIASATSDRPPDVDVRELTLSAGETGGETATLSVDLRLTSDGGPPGNVSVEYRAVDADSGLVVDTVRVPVDGALDGERRVVANLTVPRSGAYDVETVVYADGQRVDVGETRVSGLASLTPDYVETAVGFQRFERAGFEFPTVEYAVTDRSDGRATLNVSAYVVNGGRTVADEVEVVFTVRESDSGAVLDREATTVEGLAPGTTVTPSVTLGAADGEDYYLDVVLRRDGRVLDTARSTADLDPNASLSVDRSEQSDGLQVDGGTDTDPTPDRTTTVEETDGDGGPGLGVGAALVGIAVAVLVGRWRDD